MGYHPCFFLLLGLVWAPTLVSHCNIAPFGPVWGGVRGHLGSLWVPWGGLGLWGWPGQNEKIITPPKARSLFPQMEPTGGLLSRTRPKT